MILVKLLNYIFAINVISNELCLTHFQTNITYKMISLHVKILKIWTFIKVNHYWKHNEDKFKFVFNFILVELIKYIIYANY